MVFMENLPLSQEIDFLAPGENIWDPYSTAINSLRSQTIKKDSGTSYAAPAVTGFFITSNTILTADVTIE